MTISLTVWLVIAGVVLLAFGIGSTRGAIRFVSGGAALVVAILSTSVAILLFWLGAKAGWTSDGPGALFIMIGVAVGAIVAVIAWVFAFGVATSAATNAPGPLDALPEAPRDFKRVLRLLGLLLIATAVVGQAVTAWFGRARPAHAAPVAAVSFATARPVLVTADAAGTIVAWDLRTKRETQRNIRPELAGVSELFIASTPERAYAIVNGQALRLEPFGNGPVEAMPGARHIARSGHVVIAKARSLVFTSYSDWTRPATELEWPEEILAIDATDDVVIVADRASITALDGRVNSTRTLATAPAPGAVTRLEILQDMTVLALGGGGAWLLDLRRGTTEPFPATPALAASARHVLLVSGREVSEYDRRKKSVTPLGTVGPAARVIDTRAEHVALGFEGGEVTLGTRIGTRLETVRLNAKPMKP